MKKKRGEKKKINACDQLFVFTLRTDRFSVPLSIVGLIISPLFTRNYSLLAKRIENQFLQCSLNCAPIDKTHFFPFHSDNELRQGDNRNEIFRTIRFSRLALIIAIQVTKPLWLCAHQIRIFLTIQFEFRHVIHRFIFKKIEHHLFDSL